MRTVGHLARVADRSGAYSVLVGRYHLKNLGADGMIALKWIFKTWDREI
jgi:hypothetical protein